MLRNRHTGKHPVFLSHKTEDYLTFTKGLVRLRQGLVDLKAYGMDNEDALCKALQITFANSVSLLCHLHKKENIEHHLHSTLKVSPNVKEEIVHGVFGQKLGKTGPRFSQMVSEIPVCRYQAKYDFIHTWSFTVNWQPQRASRRLHNKR